MSKVDFVATSKPQVGLEAAMRQFEEARTEVYVAVQKQRDAQQVIVEACMTQGWTDCLQPKMGLIRRRVRQLGRF